MAQVKELTEGRTLPLLFKFALPLLLGQILQQMYSLIDAAIVGRFLGIGSLAANLFLVPAFIYVYRRGNKLQNI